MHDNINLNNLIVQYKQTGDKKILNDIFSLLKNTIKEKSKYVYYHQRFNAKNLRFKLVDTKQIELIDIIQELNLFIMKLIDRCEIDKPFDKYLFSSLWNWKPTIINREFKQNVRNKSLSDIDEEQFDVNFPAPITEEETKEKETINTDDMFKKLTKREKKVIELLKNNPELNQFQLAEILGVTQQNISLIMQSLQKKYKK